MIKMLKAVGFTEDETIDAVDHLLKLFLVKTKIDSNNEVFKTEYGNRFECFLTVAENTGVIYRGVYDKMGKMRVTHLFPAHIGKQESVCNYLNFSKRFDSDAVLALTVDMMLGEFVFYVQNYSNLLNLECDDKEKHFFDMESQNDDNIKTEYRVRLSCLAEEGIIILPSKPVGIKERVIALDSRMFPKPEAVEIDDTVNDIYSVVDTTFHPYGADSESYEIVGNILEVSEQMNKYTKEILCILLVECNNVQMEVCICKKYLKGTPLPGRRFKGKVWLQGYIGEN